MKLYVLDKKNNGKVFLRTVAPNRQALAQKLGAQAFKANGITYYVSDVVAEKGSDNTALGMLVGGVIGALGAVRGLQRGGNWCTARKGTRQKEEAEVAQFNGSIA